MNFTSKSFSLIVAAPTQLGDKIVLAPTHKRRVMVFQLVTNNPIVIVSKAERAAGGRPLPQHVYMRFTSKGVPRYRASVRGKRLGTFPTVEAAMAAVVAAI